MGKGKRSRERNAADIIGSVQTPKKKDSLKFWTNAMIIAIAVILVASMALSFVMSSGILLRAPHAFKSENFEINGAMMQYMFRTQYNSFYSTMYSYMKYFTLDTSRPLRDQNFSGTSTAGSYQETLLSQLYGDDLYTEGTWFDFFWDITEKQARMLLLYCEAAKAQGIELTKEELDEIDAEIKKLGTTASSAGYPSTKAYLYSIYGTGIKKKDVRNVMVLTALANKYYEQESEKILEGITDEQVKAFFEEHKSDYLKADYYFLNFEAALDAKDKEKPTEDELKKFEEDIAKAKEHANAVAALETVEEVKDYMINYWLEKYYDSYLTTAETDLKKNDSKTGKPTITDKDIPTDDTVKAENKDKVFQAVKEAIKNDTKDADLKDMGTNPYDKVLTSTRNKLLTQIKKSLDGLLSEKVSYSDSTDEGLWVFAEDRKEGDVKIFNSDEKKDDEEEKDEDEVVLTFTSSVYRIAKPRYLQEELVREFGHILISEKAYKDTSDATEKDKLAKAEAERILAEFTKAELTKEAFEALAKDKNEDGNEFYEDVKPGDMVTEMNDWLFEEGRKVNDTAIIKTTYGYHVTWLVGFGKEIWFIDSKNDYYAELLEKLDDDLAKEYSINENEKFADKIDA